MKFIFPFYSKDIELSCPPGNFSVGGKAFCDPCPPGHACQKDGTINPCLDGEFAIGAAEKCTPCPKGFACPNTTTDSKIKCESGFYATGKKTECTGCRAGL